MFFYNIYSPLYWMNAFQALSSINLNLINQSLEYCFDTWQKSILFVDVLRKRGNNYLEHVRQGQPPVLTFDYEIILDGRDLDPPTNYALVRILGKRHQAPDMRQYPFERRHYDQTLIKGDTKDIKRPIIIIDPRAGHGPGIGGSKKDSQVGNALAMGHPVYFIIFYTDPEPGQTLSDVHNAMSYFIEVVNQRHPEADRPVVIGNCQAGWAAALIGAEKPEITGPMVLSGAPLSFWSGIDGKTPMGYRAGLCGGVWLVSFLCDLGNGTFDGANLVAGFEDLNPANTLWTKQYNLYSRIDTEEDRYLKFEKWWGGYFLLNDEEIHYIVDSLFVGNKFEQGSLEITKGKRVNLSDIEEPILVFASRGDNITPPEQALYWIKNVYGSVDELIRQQKVLVYMVHERIGHLGIFVSKSVARKEHQNILKNIDFISYLPPGLYEMVIEETEGEMGFPDYKPRFEERTLKDLLSSGKYTKSDPSFQTVAHISSINDKNYKTFVRPWVRMLSTEFSAEFLRQSHPLRIQRYMFSDLNPFLLPFKLAAQTIKEHRLPASKDNLFVSVEHNLAKLIENSLDLYRLIRDRSQEFCFKSLYANPWTQSMFLPQKTMTTEEKKERLKLMNLLLGQKQEQDKGYWLNRIEEGGFVEGVTRILMCMISVSNFVNKCELEYIHELVKIHERFQAIGPSELQQIIKDQCCLLCQDEERALKALKTLLPDNRSRFEALDIAESFICVEDHFSENKREILQRIKTLLEPAQNSLVGQKA